MHGAFRCSSYSFMWLNGARLNPVYKRVRLELRVRCGDIGQKLSQRVWREEKCTENRDKREEIVHIIQKREELFVKDFERK